YEAPQNGVLSLLPKSWVPYAELMRIEKPGGLYGFYFPYLIGLSYAASIADPVISPGHLLSTAGLLLMWNVILRGAVCTINDNFDREYDRKVARCRLRPIARGAVTPVQGHIWYTAQAIVGLGFVSFLPHSTECMYHAVPIMLLLSIYPLAKRVTDFPQVVLCVPLAWGILMSCSALGIDPFTAQSNAIAAASACLMSSNALWLIMLDYVNACQDSLDDVKAGVRSMAVRYQNTEAFISVLGTAQVSLMVAAGYLAGMTPIYYVIACGGNAAMLVAMARTVTRARPDICAWWFLRGSILVGGTTVLGLLGEYMMK
ncbi:UbiA prenyltransferase family, partial [Bisporella sp. PMI_857]